MKHYCAPGDPNSVIPALHGLQPGRSIVYHIGILAADKENYSLTETQRADIKFIAKIAMELHIAGKIELTQCRHKEVYRYIATGRKRKADDAITSTPKKPEIAGCLD